MPFEPESCQTREADSVSLVPKSHIQRIPCLPQLQSLYWRIVQRGRDSSADSPDQNLLDVIRQTLANLNSAITTFEDLAEHELAQRKRKREATVSQPRAKRIESDRNQQVAAGLQTIDRAMQNKKGNTSEA